MIISDLKSKIKELKKQSNQNVNLRLSKDGTILIAYSSVSLFRLELSVQKELIKLSIKSNENSIFKQKLDEIRKVVNCFILDKEGVAKEGDFFIFENSDILEDIVSKLLWNNNFEKLMKEFRISINTKNLSSMEKVYFKYESYTEQDENNIIVFGSLHNNQTFNISNYYKFLCEDDKLNFFDEIYKYSYEEIFNVINSIHTLRPYFFNIEFSLPKSDFDKLKKSTVYLLNFLDRNKINKNNSEIECEAMITFCASPLSSLTAYIKLVEDSRFTSAQINAIVSAGINFSDFQDISLLGGGSVGFKGKKLEKVTFYDVGNGLASILQYKDNINIIYDIGLGRRGESLPGDFNRIKEFSGVIISHWHIDHFIGLGSLKRNDIYIKKWYIRSNFKNSDSSKNVVAVLYCINKILKTLKNIFYFKEGKKINLNFADSMNIFCSDSTTGYNESSICMILNDVDKKLLLCGDASYKTISETDNEYLKEVRYLQVSHHGGGDNFDKKFVPTTCKHSESLAIIPTGCNSYKHPKKENIEALINNEFKTFKTCNCLYNNESCPEKYNSCKYKTCKNGQQYHKIEIDL